MERLMEERDGAQRTKNTQDHLPITSIKIQQGCVVCVCVCVYGHRVTILYIRVMVSNTTQPLSPSNTKSPPEDQTHVRLDWTAITPFHQQTRCAGGEITKKEGDDRDRSGLFGIIVVMAGLSGKL